MKYRKKPVVIEAIQITDNNLDEICAFCPTVRLLGKSSSGESRAQFVIPTLGGAHIANRGDFIIRSITGEFYPCKPDSFEQTYEKAEE